MNTIKPIAAIYVETDGCYFGQDGIDAWERASRCQTLQWVSPRHRPPPLQALGQLLVRLNVAAL